MTMAAESDNNGVGGMMIEVGGTNGLNGVHVAADPSTGDDEDCGRLIWFIFKMLF